MTLSIHLDAIAATIIERGYFTPYDETALRRLIWADGAISLAEADRLFKINDELKSHDAKWTSVFVEAIAEIILRQGEPRGFISEATALWLISKLEHHQDIASLSELEVLARVIDRAEAIPLSLVRYGLTRIASVVVEGDGAVSATEVSLLRRILHGAASENRSGISRAEAELIYDLHDATINKSNADEWDDFFVKAIANHLLLDLGGQNLTPDQAIGRADWLNKNDGIGATLMAWGTSLGAGKIDWRGAWQAVVDPNAAERADSAEKQAKINAAAAITATGFSVMEF
jgi:hypothetical protein